MPHDTPHARISRQLLLILATAFLNIMGLGLILPILPFYATEYGADGAHVGLLFTAFSGMQFLASPVFGALSDRYGRRPIILFGVLGQVLVYLVMGFATSLGMLFASRIFAGLTAGNISATQAYVADITRPEDRTRAYGLVGAAFGAGLLFGPALGGGLSLIDSRAPAFGAAALLAINLLLGSLLYRARLVPRVLPALGLIGAPLLIASVLTTLFGLKETVSVWSALATLPIAVWEFSLGLWLVVKGFNAAASAPAPATVAPVAPQAAVAASRV